MAFEDAIVALHQNWDDVMTRLGADGREQLAVMVGALDGPEFPRVASRLSGFFVATLPSEHPVRSALESGRLFALATLDWPAICRHLRRLTTAGTPSPAERPADLPGQPAEPADLPG